LTKVLFALYLTYNYCC